MKRCAKCGQDKPRSEFWRQATTSDGLGSYCKPCNRLAKAAWVAMNPERVRTLNIARNEQKRAWDRAQAAPCIDCGAELSRRRVERCVDCSKAARHQRAYERTARWLELRGQGLDNKDIAAMEGVKAHVVACVLQYSHVMRFPDLIWEPAPYMNGQPRKKVAA